MDCLITVLKSIGMFFVALVLLGAGVAAIAVAGFGTARCFGWPDWAGTICMMAYLIVAVGTFMGVMECRHARGTRRIRTAG